jgi:hypothetical protein
MMLTNNGTLIALFHGSKNLERSGMCETEPDQRGVQPRRILRNHIGMY